MSFCADDIQTELKLYVTFWLNSVYSLQNTCHAPVCVSGGGCVCVWPRLATDQDPSWKHVEREESLGMLRCSQQVLSTLLQVPRPLNPLSLCFFPSSPQGLFPLFSFFLDPSSFVHLIPNSKGKHLMEHPLAVSLIATHTNTHTPPCLQKRKLQQLVCTPCFSKGAVLIPPDKGWASQENMSAHRIRHVQTHTAEYAAALSV